jgi:hypothetical protein
MSNESTTPESGYDHDVQRRVSWLLRLGGSIPVLYYECLWSWHALGHSGTTSFGSWLWTSLGITAPWSFCLACLSELRDGVKNGKISGDIYMKLSMSVEMGLLSVYMLAIPEIQRLMSLGILK